MGMVFNNNNFAFSNEKSVPYVQEIGSKENAMSKKCAHARHICTACM